VSVSKRSAVVLALGLTLAAGSSSELSAQARGAGGGGRGAPPMTPLLYRQNIMEQLQQSMSALTAIRNGTVGAPSHLVGRATIVQQLAAALSDAFPAGSGGDGSRALPAIWSSPADFDSRIQAIEQAANTLVEAARAGNVEGVAAAQTSVQQACAGCHMQFRGPASGA
jgi:cytochrome c556